MEFNIFLKYIKSFKIKNLRIFSNIIFEFQKENLKKNNNLKKEIYNRFEFENI